MSIRTPPTCHSGKRNEKVFCSFWILSRELPGRLDGVGWLGARSNWRGHAPLRDRYAEDSDLGG